MIIILLSGWSHSGKDTVAKILVETYGFYKYAFADPVKKQVAAEEDIPIEWCYDQIKKSQVLRDEYTLRDLLIRAGEAKPNVFWASKIAEKIRARTHLQIVISDWRKLDELWTLQKLVPEATIVPIRIERESQMVSPVPDPTEYGLLGFPFRFTMQNNGSLHRLLAQTTDLVEKDLEKYIHI